MVAAAPYDRRALVVARSDPLAVGADLRHCHVAMVPGKDLSVELHLRVPQNNKFAVSVRLFVKNQFLFFLFGGFLLFFINERSFFAPGSRRCGCQNPARSSAAAESSSMPFLSSLLPFSLLRLSVYKYKFPFINIHIFNFIARAIDKIHIHYALSIVAPSQR